MTTPPDFIKPTEAPKAGVSRDLQAWQKLTNEGPESASAASATWRNGLAGFVTLLLSVLVLKGTDVGDVAEPYRWIAIVGLVLGALLAIVGLWKALSAEAPLETNGNFDALVRRHNSVAEYLQTVAAQSWKKLDQARFFIGLSLASILVGIIAWWVAPSTSTEGKVSITWHAHNGSRTDCGSLVPAAPRTVAVQANGRSDVVAVPASDIVEMKQVAAC
jgi:hypothetical protein